MVVIAAAIETLFPNFNEAAAFNTKLPPPEITLPAKLIVPATVNVFPVPTVKLPTKAMVCPAEIVILLVLEGAEVAVTHVAPL